MSWKQKKRCLDRLAGEEGWSRKVWGESLTVCLAYPNLYRTGMSNLGFQAVYALINRHSACLCERVFFPEPGDDDPLISIESQRPLADFDIIAFSLSFENDYPQILRMLDSEAINVEYMYAFVERCGENAVIIFRFDETDKAIKALVDNGFNVLEGERLYGM